MTGQPATTHRRPARAITGALLAAALTALAACSSSGSDTAASPPAPAGSAAGSAAGGTESAALHNELPAAVRAKGSITVATDASYPPMESVASDGTTIVGLEPALGQAIGNVLGINFKFTNVTFDGIIPALLAGRFDISMTDMLDTKARQQQMDFVTYLAEGDSFLVAKGNPDKISNLASLCGKTVVVQKGTNGANVVMPQVAKCASSGKGKLTVDQFPQTTAAKQAVSTGRAAAFMDDATSMAYAAQQSPTVFQIVPGVYDQAPLGIGFTKNEQQLRNAILAALKKVIADGTYMKILKQYNSQGLALAHPGINQALF